MPTRRQLLLTAAATGRAGVGALSGCSRSGPAELEACVAAGAVPVRLGPHVLRASTAGPAALAVLQHRLGRW